MKKEIIKFVKQYAIVLILAILGLGIYFDISNIIIVLRAIGIVAVLLFVSALMLDVKQGKGLFPHYDETELLMICEKNPIAASIVIFTKNMFILVIIVLAYFFVK